ncbi:MAG: glycerophosphodiester phosphodiesterase [Gammaproteobacteria bacterium]|nr:glycerophosphodiester phosphodiesterase [Gammaproteobacteria bacterium]
MTARQRNWLLIFIALVLLILGRRLAPMPKLDSVYFETARPMVIAHQGGDGLRPGNTLVAFQNAVALGVDVLEMDVNQTRDGALVLIHDTTVDRTTNGRGAVADLTLAELKTLDAAYHWPHHGEERPYRGRGVRIPTLDEVITRFPRQRYNIELKPDAAGPAQALCATLERLNADRRVLVASFHAAAMEAFREACPAVPTSAHAGEMRWFYAQYRLGVWRLARPGAPALQVPQTSAGFDLTEAGFIDAAASRGLHLDFWTINDPADMRLLLERGAGGIITDRPDLLLQVVGRSR